MNANSVSKPNLVRLLAAVIGQASLIWFVVTYTFTSRVRFEQEHGEPSRYKSLPEFFIDYSNWGYLFPIVSLASGLWLILRCPRWDATLEILLSATWLIGLGLAGLCLLGWQVQYVKIFSGMSWHY